MVDYAPPWETFPRDPRDSIQPTPEMPLAQVRKSAISLANLLDEKKDEQVLKEACLGLCQLFGEGIQNDRIQAILEANVVPKLVALLRPSKTRTVPNSVQSAALQVLGNVACGDDRQTQVVIDSDALPCLRALLSSSERNIRKEVCWIVSNITESSHQVQDVLDADILPPLLKLLDNQDTACREDATWVLFNLSSNRDPTQIAYLAEKNGVRALCNLLACSKQLDVLWKGCGTVAAVALKGLRNILISGQVAANETDGCGFNKMASLVAEAHGVERIEALTTHDSADVRNRARLILERMFGAEPTTADLSPPVSSPSLVTLPSLTSSAPPAYSHSTCSCSYQHNQHQHQHHVHSHPATAHYQPNGLYDIAGNLTTHGAMSTAQTSGLGVEHSLSSHLHAPEGELIDVPASSSGSSTDSDPEDDDSDSDLIPPPPAPCTCVLCNDPSPLAERRPRGKGSLDDDLYKKHSSEESQGGQDVRQICEFCSGGGRLGDGRAGLAAKLGRAVRLGHRHCLAVLLSRMTWSQRMAATEAPALLHPGGGPPDGGVGNSLPSVVLAAHLGKPDCLALLLKRCRPDLDIIHGKKRLTALALAAHKSYLRCCQLLIEYGSNPGTKCGDGVTALHLAASGGGNVSICKLLIDHSSPINARSAKKQTPLCLAAQKGADKVVQLLLEHGADPNNEDEGKYTPLHLSASNGNVECVDLLLEAGARVDAMTRKGVTPLHYAVQGGHAASVKLLIAAGAEVNCNRKPLLLIAADDGNRAIVQILLDANVPVDCKANIKAMLDRDYEVFDYLTPLHLAASNDRHDVVDLLLQRGANVNELTSKSGWSALDFAVLNGHAECAVTLLEHGAIVSDNCKSIGRRNWTLVQYAAHHGAKDVVRLLIQRLQEQRLQAAANSRDSSTVGSSNVPLAEPNEPIMRVGGEPDSLVTNGVLPRRLDAADGSTQLDYLEDLGGDESDELQQQQDAMAPPKPTHRYDPRSLEGDEGGFGIGPEYSNPPPAPEPTKSRRRVVKDDRHNGRAREVRKRESEASEARERLEEAINQRSVTKLSEAITHVNKLILHLGSSVGVDPGGGNSHLEHADVNGHTEPYNNSSHNHYAASPYGKHSSTSNASSAVSAPLAMEVGLGNTVQKARKILAGLLAEDKKIREEKEREVADSKRENAHVTIKKAVAVALEGGDPRCVSRAITRATRTILDADDPVVVEAEAVNTLLSNLEKTCNALKAAMSERDLDSLSNSLPRLRDFVSQLREQGQEGAAVRALGGGNPSHVLQKADGLLRELCELREQESRKEAEAKSLEQHAKSALEQAMKSNNIVELEEALVGAGRALLSKQSELASTIESGKKVLTKWVKTERRKLRQASNTNDPDVIQRAASAAQKLNLKALQADIHLALESVKKLQEQDAAVKELESAIDDADTTALAEVRGKLNNLGMFTEAERARSELDRIQRAARARALLETAIGEAKACRDPVLKALNSKNDTIFELLVAWTWPNVQRLCDLTDRARKCGASSQALCETADRLCRELAQLGRRILGLATKSNDARAIAALISGYEKTFVTVTKSGFFDRAAGEQAIADARKRLSDVQAMDQASVKAESAQVKVEYALATSRRSAVRHRHSRARHDNRDGKGGDRSHGNYSSGTGNYSSGTGSAMSSPRVVFPNSVTSADIQSQSSKSSDYGDEEVPESESGLHSLHMGESTCSARGGESFRSNVAKKARGPSFLTDDSGVLDGGSDSGVGLGECSHFYLFKEGTTVWCNRCGHHRSSCNPEWLARVKRRGGKAAAEMLGGTLSHTSSVGDLSVYQANAMAAGLRSVGELAVGDGGVSRGGRAVSGVGAGHIGPAGYSVSGVASSRESGRHVGGTAARHGGAHASNMAMMMPMGASQGGHSAGVTKVSGMGRGRARPHIPLMSAAMDAHVQGINALYSTSGMPVSAAAVAAAAVRGHDVSGPLTSTAMNVASPYGATPLTPVLGAGGSRGRVQASPHIYDIGPLASPMEHTGGMRLATGVGSVPAMGAIGMDAILGAQAGVAADGSSPSSISTGSMIGRASGAVSRGLARGPQAGLPQTRAPAPPPPSQSTAISSGHVHADDVGGGALDLDFANENFGFDIDAIVDDVPPPGTSKSPLEASAERLAAASATQDAARGAAGAQTLANGFVQQAQREHNGFYGR